MPRAKVASIVDHVIDRQSTNVISDLQMSRVSGFATCEIRSAAFAELLHTEYGFSDVQVARILEAAERAAVELSTGCAAAVTD